MGYGTISPWVRWKIRQADAWVCGPADERLCPQDKTLTVAQAFVQEKPRLLPLPANPYPLDERVVVKVGKTPYVRFDLNDYSVPHTQVCKALTVLADTKTVRIADAQVVLASHVRSYDRGQQIEIESHIQDLVERKAQAHAQRGLGRLSQAVPASVELLAQAGSRGENLGSITAALLRLVDRYGAQEVQTAVLTALARKVPHPNAVRLALETQREARQAPAPVVVQLSEQVRLRDSVIHSHPLASYDQLSRTAPQCQPQSSRSDSDESKK